MDESNATESQFINEEKWLSENLKGKDGVLEVLKVKGKIATSKGDNFTSDIIRMTTQILLEDGQIKDRNYIVKKQTLVLDKIFDTEFRMYTEVLPKMEQLMKSKDKDAEATWCKLICWNDDKTLLVFEDLTEQGYLPSNRLVGLDIHDCLFIVRELGKFHALGVSLIEKGEINVENFRSWVLRENEELTKNIISSGLHCLVRVMKEDWDQKEWGDVTKRLEALIPNCCDKLFKTFDDQSTSKSLKVLSHGDCWACNLMIKYNPANGAPKHLKFIDFQDSVATTLAFDLVALLQCSVSFEDRQKHKETIYSVYQEALEEGLRLYGGLPSDSEINFDVRKDIKSLQFISFIFAINYLPVNICPPELLTGFTFTENVTPSEMEAQFLPVFKNSHVRKVMEKEIRFYFNEGVF